MAREALPAEPGHRRGGQHLGREELASRAKIKVGRLKAWEDGGVPGGEDLARLAAELGVSVDWILTGKGKGPKLPPS